MIGISGSKIWPKTLMELIFNPCGEFRRSPEDPVSQIHSPHLHLSALGTFSDLLRFCSDAKKRVGCGKQRQATATIQSQVTLQPWFLSLRRKTCLRQNCSLGTCTCSGIPALGQNTDYKNFQPGYLEETDNKRHTNFDYPPYFLIQWL